MVKLACLNIGGGLEDKIDDIEKTFNKLELHVLILLDTFKIDQKQIHLKHPNNYSVYCFPADTNIENSKGCTILIRKNIDPWIDGRIDPYKMKETEVK